MSEIVKEVNLDEAPVAVDSAATPVESSVPVTPAAEVTDPQPEADNQGLQRRYRKAVVGRKKCYLKSLEEGTTTLLGDDLAIFAAFDEEGSPRLTRTQTRRRKSGVEASPAPTPSPKKKYGTRGRPRKSKEPVAAAADDADDAAANVNDAAVIKDAGDSGVAEDASTTKKAKEDAALDAMEKGEKEREKVGEEEEEKKVEEEEGKGEEDEKMEEEEKMEGEKKTEAEESGAPEAELVAMEDGEIPEMN